MTQRNYWNVNYISFQWITIIEFFSNYTKNVNIEENVKCIGRQPVMFSDAEKKINQGPVVQSIVSLTSSLRGQLVKCIKTL